MQGGEVSRGTFSPTVSNSTIPKDWDQLRHLKPMTLYVQPGHYLCLGDNSPHSSDGRAWGLVPDRLMLGRALVVYWPFDSACRTDSVSPGIAIPGLSGRMPMTEQPKVCGETTIRVRYAETDRMGLLHHANYLVYFEQARTELLRSFGLSYRDLEDKGYLLVMTKVECATSGRPSTMIC